jgi:hypothetical protein
MPDLPNSPNDRRNRIGCFVILGIIALFIALYMFAGFNAAPENSVAQNIPAVGGGTR